MGLINQDAATTRAAAAELRARGYAVQLDVFSAAEVAALLAAVAAGTEGQTSPNFRRSQDVFAIRHLLKEIPALGPLLLTPALLGVLTALFPDQTPHLVKATYFDKPAGSNWLVAWHQDVMVGVHGQSEAPGFGPWSRKNGETTVRPPRKILENIVTLRLHLDECDATNGALRVVPGSHRHGVIANEQQPEFTARAVTCAVPAGGLMLMQPLTLHASQRSTSPRPRRVIHLEFASAELPAGMDWCERLAVANLAKTAE